MAPGQMERSNWKLFRIRSVLIQRCSCHLDLCAHLIGHDVGWCRWCHTATPAMHHAQLSCRRLPSRGHGKGTWVDESSRQQRLDPSIVSLAHWVGNANQPDAPPIRAVSAGGNRPFGTRPNHWKWFHWTRFPTVGCSMQRWRIVSFHSWSRRVTSRIWRRQLIWKTSSFVKSVANSVQHSEVYNKVVMMTVLKIFIFIIKLMLCRFQIHSLSQAKTPDALQFSIPLHPKMQRNHRKWRNPGRRR